MDSDVEKELIACIAPKWAPTLSKGLGKIAVIIIGNYCCNLSYLLKGL